MNSIKRRGLLAAIAAAGTAGSLAVLGIGASGAGAAVHPHARPHPAHAAVASGTAPTPFQDVNSTAAKGWCAGAPTPCDGNAGAADYGTIDLVPSKFSGGGIGDYAPFTKAAASSKMAVVTGSGDVNEGQGCPQPTQTEYCSGPYYLFDGTGTDSKFVNFTVTDDVYLSPGTAAGPNGTEVDLDSGLNNSAGAFGTDDTVSFCNEGTDFAVTFGHGSPIGCSGSATAGAGWARVVWVYQSVSGEGFLTENVWESESGHLTKVATSGPQPISLTGGSPTPVSQLGGPGYFWYPTENLPGFVPVTNLALQSGVHQQGMAP
jgi:hypothetical protein